MISKLIISTPLTAITLLMHNFIAKFVRILGICKIFAGSCVNKLGNSRGVVPKFSDIDIDVVALGITTEAFNFDSENLLFHRLHNEGTDGYHESHSRIPFSETFKLKAV